VESKLVKRDSSSLKCGIPNDRSGWCKMGEDWEMRNLNKKKNKIYINTLEIILVNII
jgi:hypothetical protein